MFASGRLSKASAARLAERVRRVVQEFRETHIEDLRLPIEERPSMSILVAMREWEFGAFRSLQRNSPTPKSKR